MLFPLHWNDWFLQFRLKACVKFMPFSAAQSPIHTPYQEYLTKWNDVNQHFMKNPVKPVQGLLQIPTAPGINMQLDTAKIEKEEEMRV